jgi:tetratricopeptide (TPR) repeat protein
LERERDDLQKKLDAANKALYGRKGSTTAARMQQLEFDLASARARLDVLEARQVPYTAEELALLKTPDTKVSQLEPTAKPRAKELPPGSTKLVAEAQSWFTAHQFDKAENAYQQVVAMDQRNVPALANLAAIQTEEGHFDAAEQNVKTALAEDPEDPFSLYVLGILRFRQAKYDDSFEALSHAAKLSPDNPEIQNKLGMALAEKGLRGPAETALRKAIQLQPNYGDAHYNLAIVYLGQQPPAIELARWHYQKATSLGHAHNADLEKKLSAR